MLGDQGRSMKLEILDPEIPEDLCLKLFQAVEQTRCTAEAGNREGGEWVDEAWSHLFSFPFSWQ